jgi:hypothetical protein
MMNRLPCGNRSDSQWRADRPLQLVADKRVRIAEGLNVFAAQTPLQRVLASGQADAARVAELKKLRLSLDPFQLGQQIDEKLQGIYQMANRRLSPNQSRPTVKHGGEKIRSRVTAKTRSGRVTKKPTTESFETEAGGRGPQAPAPFPQTPLLRLVTFQMSLQPSRWLHS